MHGAKGGRSGQLLASLAEKRSGRIPALPYPLFGGYSLKESAAVVD
jgi:hypothetical protein